MLDPRTLGIPKLAALGAVAASGGMALLWVALAVVLRPYPRGGMDGENYLLTLFTIAGILVALIALHLAIAHQLWHAPVHAAEAAGTREVRDPRDPHHPVAR